MIRALLKRIRNGSTVSLLASYTLPGQEPEYYWTGLEDEA